jgi:regulator of replication initiation timing
MTDNDSDHLREAIARNIDLQSRFLHSVERNRNLRQEIERYLSRRQSVSQELVSRVPEGIRKELADLLTSNARLAEDNRLLRSQIDAMEHRIGSRLDECISIRQRAFAMQQQFEDEHYSIFHEGEESDGFQDAVNSIQTRVREIEENE